MTVPEANMFPGFLTPVPTQLFFPKPPTTFPHALAEVRGENTLERKFASTDHESDILTTEPPGRDDNTEGKGEITCFEQFLLFLQFFYL